MYRFKTFVCFCLFALLFSCSKKVIDNNGSNKSDPTGWKLIWHDEFNYTGFPDSTKWKYEAGFQRNQEEQYYTKKRAQNCWVDSGYLTMTLRKETYPNANYKPGSTDWRYSKPYASYTSADITSTNFSFQYGRVEVRAKLPHGPGVWPAIWMLGAKKNVPWPDCGEIDIMEFVGDFAPKIFGTIHYGNKAVGVHHQIQGVYAAPASFDLSTQFHVYAMEWDSTSIKFFFDNILYKTTAISSTGVYAHEFQQPFYLIMNMAFGGIWPPANSYLNETLPQKFIIDYVRVYQH